MHSFLKACGAVGPFRLEVTHQPSGEVVRWTFPQPFVLIGRDDKADLALMDKEVSQRHAYLQMIEGRVFCVDLASRTGVRWAEGPRPSGWARPDAPIEIGPYRLRLLGDSRNPSAESGDAEDPLAPLTSPQSGLPEIELEIQADTSRRRTWLMNRRLALVGRLPFCKVQLATEAVSRAHCSLIGTPDGLWVVDLLGRGGISVNGQPQRAVRLQDGDGVEVAHFRILVRDKAARGALTLSPLGPNGATPGRESLPFPLTKPTGTSVMPLSAGRPTDLNEMVQVFLMPLASQFCLMQQQMFEQFHEAMKMAHTFSALHERQVDLIRRELDRQAELTKEMQALQKDLTARPPSPPVVRREPGTRPPSPSAPPRPPARKPVARPPAPPPEGHPPSTSAPVDGDAHDWLARRIDSIQKERESSWQIIKRVLLGGQAADGVP